MPDARNNAALRPPPHFSETTSRGRQEGRAISSRRVLFTDIVGSTELAAELGDRGWRDLVQEHHSWCGRALRRHGGREVDTAGDSFFAVFDAPAAAAECALEVIEAVRRSGSTCAPGCTSARSSRSPAKLAGSRFLSDRASCRPPEPGEVLVSSTVQRPGCRRRLPFRQTADAHELKGVPGEWHLYAVSPPAPSR